jgi:hypothetical protein
MSESAILTERMAKMVFHGKLGTIHQGFFWDIPFIDGN